MIKLADFKLKKNEGWTTVLANSDLSSLGFKTSRLGKFDGSGCVQVTIGSTIQGQRCGLNIDIESLIASVFSNTQITHTASTNGKADEPKYPTFQGQSDSDKLNYFFIQLERLIVDRA